MIRQKKRESSGWAIALAVRVYRECESICYQPHDFLCYGPSVVQEFAPCHRSRLPE